MRIWVVDDDDAIVRLFTQALERRGHDVVGRETHPADDALAGEVGTAWQDRRLDVLLLDGAVPGPRGMRAVRASATGLPVVAICATLHRAAECIAAGADGFVLLPCLETDLEEAVGEARRAASQRSRWCPDHATWFVVGLDPVRWTG